MSLNNKSVLIAGGAGYIGQVLTRQLSSQGWHVTVLDSFIHGRDLHSALSVVPGVEIIEGDIRDLDVVSKALKNKEALVILAALVGEKACDISPHETFDVNYLAPIKLLKQASVQGVSRIIFTSTDSCYGAREGEKLDEESSLAPLSTYAKLKAQVEEEFLQQSRHLPQIITILRLATVYGLSERIRFDLAVNLLVREAVLKKRAVIFSGLQWRPLVAVSDVARAFGLVLEAKAELVRSQVFNVGSNRQNVTFNTIGEILKNLVPEASIETVAADPDLRDYFVKFDKIASVLGFEALTEIPDGMRAVKEALENGFPADPYARQWSNTP